MYRKGQYISFTHPLPNPVRVQSSTEGDFTQTEGTFSGWIVDNRPNQPYSTYKVKLNDQSAKTLNRKFIELADCEIIP